jgi:Spy/CpxP family protein refolding chaperone
MPAAIAVAGLLVGLAAAGAPAVAQNSPPVPSADQDKGLMPHEMKHGGMMKPGMMMGPEMQRKMSRMVDNCNRMMEAMNSTKNGAPAPSDKD